MSTILQSLGIHRLSVEERLALVEEIWESIAAQPDSVPITEAQKHELERRVAAHRANPSEAMPWETIKRDRCQPANAPGRFPRHPPRRRAPISLQHLLP